MKMYVLPWNKYNVPNIIAYCDSAKTKYDMCVIV